MYKNDSERLKAIFSLRSMIEKVYFKSYECSRHFQVDLNHTHIKTLMILKFEGESSMSAISDKLNLEKGSFTPVANKLINYDFIEKIIDPKDKRVYNLRLTEKGCDFSEEFSRNHIEYINGLLDCLSENEKNLYLAAIELVDSMTMKIYDDCCKKE